MMPGQVHSTEARRGSMPKSYRRSIWPPLPTKLSIWSAIDRPSNADPPPLLMYSSICFTPRNPSRHRSFQIAMASCEPKLPQIFVTYSAELPPQAPRLCSRSPTSATTDPGCWAYPCPSSCAALWGDWKCVDVYARRGLVWALSAGGSESRCCLGSYGERGRFFSAETRNECSQESTVFNELEVVQKHIKVVFGGETERNKDLQAHRTRRSFTFPLRCIMQSCRPETSFL